MIRVEKFKAEHVLSLGKPLDVGKRIETQEQTREFTVTAFVGEDVVAIGGVGVIWSGRGEAWAIVSEKALRFPIAFSKAALRFLNSCPVRRIEAAADWRNKRENKWIERLGFQRMGFAGGYFPDGRDAYFYARVRGN